MHLTAASYRSSWRKRSKKKRGMNRGGTEQKYYRPCTNEHKRITGFFKRSFFKNFFRSVSTSKFCRRRGRRGGRKGQPTQAHQEEDYRLPARSACGEGCRIQSIGTEQEEHFRGHNANPATDVTEANGNGVSGSAGEAWGSADTLFDTDQVEDEHRRREHVCSTTVHQYGTRPRPCRTSVRSNTRSKSSGPDTREHESVPGVASGSSSRNGRGGHSLEDGVVCGAEDSRRYLHPGNGGEVSEDRATVIVRNGLCCGRGGSSRVQEGLRSKWVSKAGTSSSPSHSLGRAECGEGVYTTRGSGALVSLEDSLSDRGDTAPEARPRQGGESGGMVNLISVSQGRPIQIGICGLGESYERRRCRDPCSVAETRGRNELHSSPHDDHDPKRHRTWD
eukprot:PhM_4_TR18660/c3_g2_i3/m.19869